MPSVSSYWRDKFRIEPFSKVFLLISLPGNTVFEHLKAKEWKKEKAHFPLLEYDLSIIKTKDPTHTVVGL